MPLRNKKVPDKAGHGPSLLRVLGRSPAALAGYLGLHQGLAGGTLTAAERCLIGLTVAQRSGSAYWLSVQGRLADKAGLTQDEISAAREGCGDSDRHTALLFLAGKLVINRGELAEADLAAVRQAGLSGTDITEVILHVGLNLTAAAVSHAAGLELDFPPAPPLPAF
ncbi:MAG TPA: carboxymuconolactone decarboxylase family protein [Dongiaceae bacterium]|nr:carboxymuconolactone decarboxylase family protein [Dongiaceae bacterium]